MMTLPMTPRTVSRTSLVPVITVAKLMFTAFLISLLLTQPDLKLLNFWPYISHPP
jgi:hypothetical protein